MIIKDTDVDIARALTVLTIEVRQLVLLVDCKIQYEYCIFYSAVHIYVSASLLI